MTLAIDRAGLSDVEDLAPLFDGYRRFYGQSPDLDLARAFLHGRLARGESTILLARLGAQAVGFTQLYPSFTSAGAARIFILNDLYVLPQAEGQGVGAALLEAAERFGRSAGAVRLTLVTGVDNQRAQALYQRAGWARSDAFVTFNRPLN
jgi:ribosomal protein S18 acetylase RimI-like enzyme